MTTIVKIRKIVQFENGNYVQKCGYHKGCFNCSDTLDITLAEDFTKREHLLDDAKLFFKNNKAKLLNIRITIQIDCPDNLPLPENCLVMKVV